MEREGSGEVVNLLDIVVEGEDSIGERVEGEAERRICDGKIKEANGFASGDY